MPTLSPLARRSRPVLLLVALVLAPRAVAHLRVSLDFSGTSHSVGTPAQGRLERGHPIPPSGPGFVTYSYLGAALGRQYVHGAVRDTLVEAFAALADERPDRRFVVGETGWPRGGRFWPHRSHENGLSVDIFMPLADAAGRPVDIGCWPWNRFGYGLEFDAEGRLGDLRIDFDDVARLVAGLDRQARGHGFRVREIILAPEYAPLLLATPAGRQLGGLAAAIVRRPVWWRHDEHVHVTFAPL